MCCGFCMQAIYSSDVGKKFCMLSVEMEGSALDHSEVYNWLKSLSPGALSIQPTFPEIPVQN